MKRGAEEETHRLMDFCLFVWRMQILEGSKVLDDQKHSFCCKLRGKRLKIKIDGSVEIRQVF